MKTISRRASLHVPTARFLITIINISLVILACYTGLLLAAANLLLPYEVLYTIAFALLITAVIFYPGRTGVPKTVTYARQKFCDLLLPLSAALVIVTSVNNADEVTANQAAYSCSILPNPTAAQILASGKSKHELTHREKRILKKEFFSQLKNYAAAVIEGDNEKGKEAVKIILAVIAMLGLFYLLTALVCELSCNGHNAAAVLVAIVGTVGIIWGFVLLIKSFHRKQQQRNT